MGWITRTNLETGVTQFYGEPPVPQRDVPAEGDPMRNVVIAANRRALKRAVGLLDDEGGHDWT
jgi:hypothetical protein